MRIGTITTQSGAKEGLTGGRALIYPRYMINIIKFRHVGAIGAGSLIFTVPKWVVEKLILEPGDCGKIEIVEGKIVVTPLVFESEDEHLHPEKLLKGVPLA
jgi:hypothetical protein